ncbi:addiction module protein [Massilia sp. TWR1-2-2]|uniref:addiction module protein n=1 Tax=Massilia sp. TWR1-2-2 TaxID=2804584 RepID=UPI003CECE2C3
METQLKKLVSAAMLLPPEERAAFAQLLLASLNSATEDDDAWELEVERRISNAENGRSPDIPMADALAQIRANLK